MEKEKIGRKTREGGKERKWENVKEINSALEKSRRHVGRSKRKVKRTIQIEQKDGGIEINKKGEGSPQDEAEIEQALKKRRKKKRDRQEERAKRERRGEEMGKKAIREDIERRAADRRRGRRRDNER